MTKPWQLLAVTHLGAALAGWMIAPRDQLETEVKSVGFFTADTRRTLAATVNSLRAESRLLVYSYRGSTLVTAEHSFLWVFNGDQELIVPAAVGYYVDLSQLTTDRLAYDERTATLTVNLPPLVLGDVAFQPEEARATNGGLLTYSQAQVDELSAENYGSARRAVIAQAQTSTLLEAARREAGAKIESLFALPLRAAGQPTVRVVARFG